MEEEVLAKSYDSRLMRRLLTYLAPYWGPVALAFVAIIVGAAAALAQPYLVKIAIDRYIAAGRTEGLRSIAAIDVLVAARSEQTAQLSPRRVVLASAWEAVATLVWQPVQAEVMGPTGLVKPR